MTKLADCVGEGTSNQFSPERQICDNLWMVHARLYLYA